MGTLNDHQDLYKSYTFSITLWEEAALSIELEFTSLRLSLQAKELNLESISQRVNTLLTLEEQINYSLTNLKYRQQAIKKYCLGGQSKGSIVALCSCK